MTVNGGAGGGGFAPRLSALDAETLLGVVEAGLHAPDPFETRMLALLAGHDGTVGERMIRVLDAHASLHHDDAADGARGRGRLLAFTAPLTAGELLEPDLDITVLGLALERPVDDRFALLAVEAVLRHRADMASALLNGSYGIS